jgi:hypothetical protein
MDCQFTGAGLDLMSACCKRGTQPSEAPNWPPNAVLNQAVPGPESGILGGFSHSPEGKSMSTPCLKLAPNYLEKREKTDMLRARFRPKKQRPEKLGPAVLMVSRE